MIQADFTRLSSKGQVVIPLEMRKDLKEGDKLLIVRKNDDIIIKKSFPESALLSEKAFAKQWLSKEDEEAFAYLQ